MTADFFQCPSAGWFLQWAVENESRAHPKSAISVRSPQHGYLCGHVPHDWDGTSITLVADDRKLNA